MKRPVILVTMLISFMYTSFLTTAYTKRDITSTQDVLSKAAAETAADVATHTTAETSTTDHTSTIKESISNNKESTWVTIVVSIISGSAVGIITLLAQKNKSREKYY